MQAQIEVNPTRVFVDRDSTGIRGLLMNGQYFVPANPFWWTVLRRGASFWKWWNFGFLVIGLLGTYLWPKKAKEGKPETFPIGLLAVAPHWLYHFAGGILTGNKYFEFGMISVPSISMLLLSWCGFLLSILLPFIWVRLYIRRQRSIYMYGSIPLILANVVGTIYLFSYGVVPFASWSH